MTTHPAQLVGGAWAFFLDVDGTLLDFAEAPDRVIVSASVLKLLGDLSAAAAGAVALVSGRSIASLDGLFSPLELPAAGLHGAERRDAAGRQHRQQLNGRLDALRSGLSDFCRRHPGTLLEDKGAAVALHYRQAPAAADSARAEIARLLPALQPDFSLQEGQCVLEVKPAGASKANAIDAFMNEAPFRGRRPVFIGDDLTDEDGFSAVNALGGRSLIVGARTPTAAQERLADVAAVNEWLSRWCATVNGETE